MTAHASPAAFLTHPEPTTEAQIIAADARARVAQLGVVLAEDHELAARHARMSWPPNERPRRRRRCQTIVEQARAWLFHRGEFRRVGR